MKNGSPPAQGATRFSLVAEQLILETLHGTSQDQDVYSFMIQNITDVRGTDTFHAGYCTGWIEALLEDRKVLH